MHRIKVAFLAYYPAALLGDHLDLFHQRVEHPASWIVNLAKALSMKADIELHVVSDSSNVGRDQDVLLDNVHYHLVKTPSTLNLSTLYVLSVQRLVRKVQEIGPHIVHAHGCEGSIGIAGVRSGLPCLVSTQGLLTAIAKADRQWFGRASMRTTLLAAIERYVLKRARYIGTRTQYATKVVTDLNPSAQILYTPEVMNELFFSVMPALSTNHAVYVGSIIARKDVSTLVRALAVVRQAVPDCRLSIVGTGPQSYRAELEKEIRALGLQSHIAFHGFLSTEEIAQLFAESSVFVLPSLIENSPNALAEAMCSGLPVVATDVGGVPSLVEDGVSGLLVPPRNPAAMAKAMLDLLTNPDKLSKMGSAARAKALRTHTASIVAEQTIAVYRQILETEERKQAA